MYLVQVILLRERDGLAPAQVGLVDVRCDPSELGELVFLKLRRKTKLIAVVVRGDAVAERFVVFLLDQQFVDCLVDSCQIRLLDGQQVVLDQWQVVCFAHDVHHSSMVHARFQDLHTTRDSISRASLTSAAGSEAVGRAGKCLP